MRQKYETDLTDEQWDVIAPLFVDMRNCKWDKRELTNAVLYLVKTGVAKGLTQCEAISDAVKFCISNEIMKGYLEYHSEEVFNMLALQWDKASFDDELLKHLPLSPENEQTKQIFSLILRQLQQQNPNIDMQRFWKIYANKNEWLINVTNQNALSICIPLQVVETLKIILKQYSSLEIVAQEGYKELSNLAGITKTRVGIVTFFKWIL